MNFLKASTAIAVFALAALYTAPAFAQGTVYVVHGIPGEDLGAPTDLPVDVSVNGACALEGFVVGDIVGPLAFEAGSYDIEISLANADTPCGNEAVISAGGIPVEDGGNYSIVAHLDEGGAPTASVIVNNLDTSAYSSRLNVAHLAAAPRVDIKLADRKSWLWWLRPQVIRDVGNGEFTDISVRPRNYNVSTAPAGPRPPVFGPIPVSPERDTV